ncbi:hypothetical protein IMSAG049_01338 [Clostridiales bacterium]|nr:hypothetical protein IMSAG049_01338 [Clostridiales bacterium]
MKNRTVLTGKNMIYPQNCYYLIERQTARGNIYGLMITNNKDECCIPGVFESAAEAEKFSEMLIENNVSPVHLPDAIDDYMGSNKV